MFYTNPRKEIFLPIQKENLKKALLKIPDEMEKCGKAGYLLETNQIEIGRIVLQKTEFLSMGVKIDIQIGTENMDGTYISMEVKRVIGAFDKSYEIAYANKHIDNICTSLNSILFPEKIDQYNKNISSGNSHFIFLFLIGIILGWVIF
jgi:hypothetical protein